MRKPLTIGIGGAHSGSGKTSVAAAILRYFTSPSPDVPPVLTALKRWGAIKYTKTALYSSIIDNRDILDRKDKDTGRLMEAGAETVLWVQSPARGVGEVLPVALDSLSHLDGVIIEGNTAIEFLRPDVVIFIFGASREKTKPSAHRLLKQADIVVASGDEGGFRGIHEQTSDDSLRSAIRRPPLIVAIGHIGNGLVAEKIRELMNSVEMVIKNTDIERLLKERSSEGRISCTLARKIAEELSISPREVGKVANELRIKIKECELGCF